MNIPDVLAGIAQVKDEMRAEVAELGSGCFGHVWSGVVSTWASRIEALLREAGPSNREEAEP